MNGILPLIVSNALMATLMAIGVALVARLVRHAPLVHALWVLVLLKLLAPPVFNYSIEAPSLSQSTPVSTQELAQANVEKQAVLDALEPELRSENEDLSTQDGGRDLATVADSHREPAGRANAQREPRPWFASSNWYRVVIGGWLAGSALIVMVSGLYVIRFRRLVRLMSNTAQDMQMEAKQLAEKLGLRGVPRVILVDADIPPLVWSFGRSTSAQIVLPRRLVDSLSHAQRHSMLLHELAHIRRGDHFVRWLEVVVTVIYWWLPVVWWARREIHRTADECCDAWVVQSIPEINRSYAEALLSTVDYVAETQAAVPPLASGFGHVKFLERRMRMILNNTLRRNLSWPNRFVLAAIALAILPASGQLVHAQRETSAAAGAVVAQTDPSAPQPDLLVTITANNVTVDRMTLPQAMSRLKSLLSGQAALPNDPGFLVEMTLRKQTYQFSSPKQALATLDVIWNLVIGATLHNLDFDQIGLPKDAFAFDPGRSGRAGAAGGPGAGAGGAGARPGQPGQAGKAAANTGPAGSTQPGAGGAGASGAAGGGGGVGGNTGTTRGGAGGRGNGGGAGTARGNQAGGQSPFARNLAPRMKAQLERALSKYRITKTGQRTSREVNRAGSQLDGKIRRHTLLARVPTRDYEKSTLSFEQALRDDPRNARTRNDWELQFGNGSQRNEFSIQMVHDDRGDIVNLGRLSWEDLDVSRLPVLDAHQNRAEVTASTGNMYLVRSADTNSDVYALVRVESMKGNECAISWKQVDVHGVNDDGNLIVGVASIR